MTYRIVLHPLVEDDLGHIHRLLSDYAGRQTADRKLEQILAFIDRLGDFPKIGTRRDEVLAGLRVLPASDKAVICFIVRDEDRTVLILSVTYAGADWHARLKER